MLASNLPHVPFIHSDSLHEHAPLSSIKLVYCQIMLKQSMWCHESKAPAVQEEGYISELANTEHKS